ncbi:hypothetical protein [Paraglaciecola sp. L3A3]|uniref:hypothetical protein n=1 Tax=Paraglaciecola sp. L3A3 TaxID=2686358 RepID=UPI00131B11D9|nr:hypothetical protein [Paraglaciecola sp. L3A3]
MEDNQQSLLNTPLHGVQLLDTANKLPTSLKQVSNTAFTLPIDVQYSSYQKPHTQPIWQLVDQGERYLSVIQLFKTEQDYTLNIECEGTGSFAISKTAIKVNWQPQGTDFKHYLQSLGIACWLELNAVPCIHANTISYQDQAYLFIAPSRTGKSTLTTHLLGDGFQLMTDDMAAIHSLSANEYMIYPSWPKVRLWPDSANNLVGAEIDIDNTKPMKAAENSVNNQESVKFSSIECKKVHQKFAKFEINLNSSDNNFWNSKPTKLKAIYYLDRSDNLDTFCHIKQLTASHSLMMLLQNSILANAYTSMGVESQRLQSLAKLLTNIPVFNINYKSGLNYLPEVGKQLKKHITGLS